MLYYSVTGCCYNNEALVKFTQNGEQLQMHFSIELTMYRDFESVIRSAMANEIASDVKSNCANHYATNNIANGVSLKFRAVENRCNNMPR